MNKIGTYIKKCREDNNITKENLLYKIEFLANRYFGEHHSISISTLSRIESGKTNPSLLHLDLISTALNVDLIEKYSEFRANNFKKTKSIINAIPHAIIKNDIKLLKKFKNFLIKNHNSNSLYMYKIIDDNIILIESYIDLINKNYNSSYLKSIKVIEPYKVFSGLKYLSYKNNYKLILMAIILSCSKFINISTNTKIEFNYLNNISKFKHNKYHKSALYIINKHYF